MTRSSRPGTSPVAPARPACVRTEPAAPGGRAHQPAWPVAIMPQYDTDYLRFCVLIASWTCIDRRGGVIRWRASTGTRGRRGGSSSPGSRASAARRQLSASMARGTWWCTARRRAAGRPGTNPGTSLGCNKTGPPVDSQAEWGTMAAPCSRAARGARGAAVHPSAPAAPGLPAWPMRRVGSSQPVRYRPRASAVTDAAPAPVDKSREPVGGGRAIPFGVPSRAAGGKPAAPFLPRVWCPRAPTTLLWAVRVARPGRWRCTRIHPGCRSAWYSPRHERNA
jgi:hypothetical protein